CDSAKRRHPASTLTTRMSHAPTTPSRVPSARRGRRSSRRASTTCESAPMRRPTANSLRVTRRWRPTSTGSFASRRSRRSILNSHANLRRSNRVTQYYDPTVHEKRRQQAEQEERWLVEFRNAADKGLSLGWQAFLSAKLAGADPYTLDREQRDRALEAAAAQRQAEAAQSGAGQ